MRVEEVEVIRMKLEVVRMEMQVVVSKDYTRT